jgi:Protein of unknown function (DUF3040)
MALPMDEQRILDEMERGLAADDPRLAARLASFGRPGVGALRSPRAKAVLSLASLALIAAVALVVYAMSAFRASSPAHRPSRQVTVSKSLTAHHRGPAAPAPAMSAQRPVTTP